MKNQQNILTGTAGVYYVASQLAAQGFNAAVTYGNAPSVDILVGLPDGSASVSLQVKTTFSALRMRGRGEGRKFDHYEWEIGKSAKLHRADLFFVLVDLKEYKELPDVFIVPSKKMYDWYHHTVKEFFNGNEGKWVRKRYHPDIDSMGKYKNNWQILKDFLAQKKY